MPLSFYEISIAVFIRGLTNLSAFLKKGEAYADEKGIPHSKLLEARLTDDMAALIYQIQRVSDSSKGAAVRIGGAESVALEDNEATFADLQGRIQKTIDILKTVKESNMVGKEDDKVVLKTGSGEMTFTAKSYLLEFAIPNFYFHETTAYALLRHMGV